MTICKKGMENVKKEWKNLDYGGTGNRGVLTHLKKFYFLFCFFVGYITIFGFRKAYL